MNHKTIVVGGGIVGLSIAWELVRSNQTEVFLYEKKQVGSQASWTAGGMLAPISELGFQEDDIFEFGRANLFVYKEYLHRVSIDANLQLPLELDPNGALIVATRRDDKDVLIRQFEFYKKRNLNVQWLQTNELREKEHLLSPTVYGGIYIPEDTQIENRELCLALKQAFLNCGGNLVEHAAVYSLYVEDSMCRGITLDSNRNVLADGVVVATGSWANYLKDMKIRPVKGQLLILEMKEKLTHVVRSPRIYLSPKSNNTLKVGATSEEVGFENYPTAGGMLDLLKYAWETAPCIYDYKFLELDKKEIYDLHLVMVEAVTNAIVHGNKLDGEKSVHVTCRITEDGLLLEVEDQGNGFDPTVIPSPLDAENLLKVTGRGIFLMKQIAQNVSYRFSTHGTALQIVLNRKKKQNQTE
ncbi:hypothetical protein CHS0354_024089 [Potamilus streckersoni]|uniref:Uncharacterized protein n=1 Tax=Potamilus streckersoni TaxID=2493646 RepID=A0AAE0VLQ3_9BIVA|nr:hypothetical protein CHS0354_024089 [Potamilus streckersoni]